MPLLDATPKSATANSFLTRTEADTYFAEDRLFVDEWTSATTPTKEVALRWSTRILSEAVEWHGAPTTTSQSLPWPRIGIEDFSNEQTVSPDVVPPFIKRICADLALELIKRNRTQEPGLVGQAIASASLGDLSVTVDKTDLPRLIPPAIAVSIAPYGTIVGAANTRGGNIPVRRA
jgi:hypothetical protein